MKKYFVLLFATVLASFCVFSGITAAVNADNNSSALKSADKNTLADNETADKDIAAESLERTEQTTSTASAPILTVATGDSVTLSETQADVIKLSAADEALLKGWSAKDSGIVTVDDGGRLDAVKKGVTTVTATFLDNRSTVYEVEVKKSDEKEPDIYSTAITANEDVLSENLKNSKKKNPYKIRVNQKKNCVTVYTYDKNGKYTVPVRAMVCSCGKDNSTIQGDFSIYYKSKWNALFNNVYGQYTCGFSGNFLFHSVPYEKSKANTLEVDEYNKLGSQASLGCVRLACADAKWIYDNCAVNTEVNVYESDNAGPLGKPETIKINGQKLGWDPTDNNSDNPYKDKKPVIKGAENKTIRLGESFSPQKDVTALDTCSNDITYKLVITGNVVTARAGKYKLTYSVTDALHRSAEKAVWITVK